MAVGEPSCVSMLWVIPTVARDRPSPYVKNFCRWGSPDPNLFGWRAGVSPARFFIETREVSPTERMILLKFNCLSDLR